MSFGRKLKSLRIENKMTQSELATKINLSKANVSKYESDLVEPNLATLTMISLLFNVSTDYLLGVENKPEFSANYSSENMQTLISSCSDLTGEELNKVIEYIDFLKTKR